MAARTISALSASVAAQIDSSSHLHSFCSVVRGVFSLFLADNPHSIDVSIDLKRFSGSFEAKYPVQHIPQNAEKLLESNKVLQYLSSMAFSVRIVSGRTVAKTVKNVLQVQDEHGEDVCACQIEFTDLFFALPVRMKALRETCGDVRKLVEMHAVAYPACYFTLRDAHSGVIIVSCNPAALEESEIDRFAWFYKWCDVQQVETLNNAGCDPTFLWRGFVVPSPKTACYVFVNRKIVKAGKVARFWRSFTALAGMQCTAVLFLDCAEELFFVSEKGLDCYVHFYDWTAPLHSLEFCVHRTVVVESPQPRLSPEGAQKTARQPQKVRKCAKRSEARNAVSDSELDVAGKKARTTENEAVRVVKCIAPPEEDKDVEEPVKWAPKAFSGEIALEKSDLANVRVIRQLDRKFILCVCGSRVLVFDQHAVDERVRLERLQRELPLVVERCDECRMVDGETRELCEANRERLESWGWEFHFFNGDGEGEVQLVLDRCGALWGTKFGLDAMLEYVALLPHTAALPPAMQSVVAQRACHSAVRFGDELSVQECCALIEGLNDCVTPFQCAHGRPNVCPLCDVGVFKHRFL